MARALVGLKIRDRRKALGVTQASLAERLAISPSYLNLIEGNRRNIAGSLLKRIADELGVAVDEFDGAAERRLIDDLGELAADARVGALGLDASSAADLAAQHPGWARALVALHRSCIDREQAVAALSDRLNQDPFLGDAVHSMLSSLTAIRSASEILDSVAELEPAQRQRFVSIIAGDSRRAADTAQAMAAFFHQAHTSARSITPVEEVDDFFAEHEAHFPTLEAAAGALRAQIGLPAEPVEGVLAAELARTGGSLPPGEPVAPATRRFRLARAVSERACADAIAGLVDRAPQLRSAAARRRAEQALASYAAGALLMPYDAFLQAARAARYDIDVLARRFGASFEQVCHRLASLRRQGAQGIRFGFMRTDPAGYVTKRFALPRLPLPRHGNACPLWAVYAAFQSPGATVRQIAEFPGGERYLFIARAVDKERPAFGLPRHLLSIMLACDALHADQTVYGDGLDLSSATGATPVGQSCRVCVRRGCAYREEDPIIDAGGPTGRPEGAPWRTC